MSASRVNHPHSQRYSNYSTAQLPFNSVEYRCSRYITERHTISIFTDWLLQMRRHCDLKGHSMPESHDLSVAELNHPEDNPASN